MLYPAELRARKNREATRYKLSEKRHQRQLFCNGSGRSRFFYGRGEHWHLLYDVQPGASQQLMNRGLVQPRCVILYPDGLLRLVELNPSHAIDFASPGNCQRSSLRRWHSIPVQNIKLCHAIDHTKMAEAAFDTT